MGGVDAVGDAEERAAAMLGAAIAHFSPADLRSWAEGLGEATFVGSSGRVFPRSFKATPLLRAWLRRLDALGVELRPRRRLVGLAPGPRLRFAGPDGEEEATAEAAVLALEEVRRALAGKAPKKVIVVPQRIVNVVA